MAQLEILEKLNKELEKDIEGEPQIIYILSRIRKLLELQNLQSRYKYLNFYCNWALHAEINDVDSISEILQRPGENTISLFHLYVDFDKEFKKFLDKNNLETSIFTEKKILIEFHHLLSEIYTDTPLILKTIKKKKITFHTLETGHNLRDGAAACRAGTRTRRCCPSLTCTGHGSHRSG